MGSKQTLRRVVSKAIISWDKQRKGLLFSHFLAWPIIFNLDRTHRHDSGSCILVPRYTKAFLTCNVPNWAHGLHRSDESQDNGTTLKDISLTNFLDCNILGVPFWVLCFPLGNRQSFRTQPPFLLFSLYSILYLSSQLELQDGASQGVLYSPETVMAYPRGWMQQWIPSRQQ